MVFPKPPVHDRWFQHENISSENNWPLVANRRCGFRQNGERPETHCGCKQSQIHPNILIFDNHPASLRLVREVYLAPVRARVPECTVVSVLLILVALAIWIAW